MLKWIDYDGVLKHHHTNVEPNCINEIYTWETHAFLILQKETIRNPQLECIGVYIIQCEFFQCFAVQMFDVLNMNVRIESKYLGKKSSD